MAAATATIATAAAKVAASAAIPNRLSPRKTRRCPPRR
jgi:hypothetical protein